MKLIFKIYLIFSFVVIPNMAYACSVCFGGDPESPQMIGLRWGILVLLGILLGILGLLGKFFLNFRKRSKLTWDHFNQT